MSEAPPVGPIRGGGPQDAALANGRLVL
jgi:hypothetical protein